ncbi:MAG: hypothetical protein J7463_17635, partial [Roseiflexus sp.]|nr:hypothetical protein [Roseiflexus sp.]
MIFYIAFAGSVKTLSKITTDAYSHSAASHRVRLDTEETPSYTTPVVYILLEKAMGRMAITIIGAEARDIRFPTS